jgi:hypothetical protein
MKVTKIEGHGVRRGILPMVAAGLLACFVARRIVGSNSTSRAQPQLAVSSATSEDTKTGRQLAAVVASAHPVRSPDPDTSDPKALMRGIREAVKSDPKLSETLARRHRQEFADSSEADERDAFLVYAVYNQRRFRDASLEAHYYLEHHPSGQFVRSIEDIERTHFR